MQLKIARWNDREDYLLPGEDAAAAQNIVVGNDDIAAIWDKHVMGSRSVLLIKHEHSVIEKKIRIQLPTG